MYGTKTLKNSVKIAYSHSCIYNCKYIYEFHCLTTCLQKCQSAKTQFKYWRPRLTPSYLPAFTTPPPPPPTLTWIVFLPSQSLHDYSTFPQNLSVTIPLDVTWLFLFFSLLSLTNSSPLAISLTVRSSSPHPFFTLPLTPFLDYSSFPHFLSLLFLLTPHFPYFLSRLFSLNSLFLLPYSYLIAYSSCPSNFIAIHSCSYYLTSLIAIPTISHSS